MIRDIHIAVIFSIVGIIIQVLDKVGAGNSLQLNVKHHVVQHPQ